LAIQAERWMCNFRAGRLATSDNLRNRRGPMMAEYVDLHKRLQSKAIAAVIERNLQAIGEHRRKAEAKRGWHQHLADRITRFAGSMTFIYLHVAWFAIWLLVNAGLFGLPAFDPAYTVLTMIVSLEAIFLSTFVLVSQNRQAEVMDQRAQLDLQINLLAEYEITRILTLLDAIGARAGTRHGDQELRELERDVEPEKVLDRIEDDNNRQ
jgi:uncharacterized membrane protein